MSCITPFKIQMKNGQVVEVPCRHCVGCTIKKVQELRVYAQAQQTEMAFKGYSSSFVRLSYNDAFLPVVYHGKLCRLGELVENGKVPTDFENTLLKTDFQKFMKRLRQEIARKYDNRKIKYIYCGEYGDSETGTKRPHYHIVLFGLSYVEAELLISETWKFGFCTFLPLKPGAVRYISLYIYQDVFGKEREQKYTSKGKEPPFIYHSTNLGKEYLKQYHSDGTIKIGGMETAFPTYYRKKYNIQPKKLVDAKDLEQFKKEALKKAQEYVIKQRQRGIPVDDSTVKTSQDLTIYQTNKINNLVKDALK